MLQLKLRVQFEASGCGGGYPLAPLREEEGLADDVGCANFPGIKCGESAASDFADATENQQVDLEKYALGDTPPAGENLQNLEFRIGQLEKNPESTRCVDGEFATIRTLLEKATTCHHPLGRGHHHRKLSQVSIGSSSVGVGVVNEVSVGNEFVAEAPVLGGFKEVDATFKSGESSTARKVDSDFGDGENDRVHTIVSVIRQSRKRKKETKDSHPTLNQHQISEIQHFPDPHLERLVRVQFVTRL